MPAVLVADRYGRYLDANEEALVLFGVSLEQLRALKVGAFSGPHAELAITVWHRLAATGSAMPTGESTVHRPDGTQLRVRYLRIEPRADGAYELELVEVPSEADARPAAAPPVADHPRKVLEEWRAAERAVAAGDTDGALTGAEGLRELYQHSVLGKSREPASS